MLRAAASGPAEPSGPEAAARARELRDGFRTASGADGPDVSASVVRLGPVFTTPPACEWPGGAALGPWDEAYCLSGLDASQEWCFVRGPAADRLADLADRAGALLPAWPADPRPPVLAAPGELVTDDRGNVERWLAFVFTTLRERSPGSVELLDDPTGRPAVLRLRGVDPFEASARAIELAGWVAAAATPAASVPPAAQWVPGRKGKDINGRMFTVMSREAESRDWSAKMWAEHLGCSPGTVKETDTWKDLQKLRAELKAEAADRMRSPGSGRRRRT